MNKMTTDVFRACHGKLDPKRRLNTMEVFGLDFMICDEFRPYLIEVNTNPCLELSSPLLARLIPTMLENSFKIGIDGVFFPPEHFSSKKAFIGDACPENRCSDLGRFYQGRPKTHCMIAYFLAQIYHSLPSAFGRRRWSNERVCYLNYLLSILDMRSLDIPHRKDMLSRCR